MTDLKIGFIGQGFLGKNFADNFEARGFTVIRYSLEEPYIRNREKIKEADIVFVAVPTPTTPHGFDGSILHSEIKNLVGKGKIVVIKSTILPGTTESIQKENPEIFILHSPEFLTEKTARRDTDYPERNIVGLPIDNKEYRTKAELVLSVLPKAPFEKIMLSRESELVKYVGNNLFYVKLVFINLMYDLAKKIGADWQVVSEAVAHDSRIGKTHLQPVHPSGISNKPGRGAGGHCFPKDFEALLQFYRSEIKDEMGLKVLESIRDKNVELLEQSGKDADILAGIYNIDKENDKKK